MAMSPRLEPDTGEPETEARADRLLAAPASADLVRA